MKINRLLKIIEKAGDEGHKTPSVSLPSKNYNELMEYFRNPDGEVLYITTEPRDENQSLIFYSGVQTTLTRRK